MDAFADKTIAKPLNSWSTSPSIENSRQTWKPPFRILMLDHGGCLIMAARVGSSITPEFWRIPLKPEALSPLFTPFVGRKALAGSTAVVGAHPDDPESSCGRPTPPSAHLRPQSLSPYL